MNAGEVWFLVLVWLCATTIFFLVLIVVMHFIMPKKVIITYFKKPHFKESELTFFVGPIFSLMRTVMFMTVIAFPNRGKKRGLTKAHLLAPHWYRILAKVTIVGTLFFGFAFTVGVFSLGSLAK